MRDPLDDVAYLGRSENRVAILRAVDERPRDRRELEGELGLARSTLSRVIRELEEDRGWIRRTEGGYESTTAGSMVLDRFEPLYDTLRGLRTLGDALSYLPIDSMDVDVRHFDDAELRRPTEFDPTAAFEYGVRRARESEVVRSVARTVPPPYVRALHEEVTTGELTAEIVLDVEYLETVAGSELATLWREIADRADIRRYDDHNPYRLIVLDEVVHMWLCSDEGEQAGLLETENSTVREWAQATVDRYLAAAEPVRELPA